GAVGDLRVAGFVAAPLRTAAERLSLAARAAGGGGDCDAARDPDRGGRGGGAGDGTRGRIPRALAVLCQRGSEEGGSGILRSGEGGRMNFKRLIGIDHLASDYAYGQSAETGYTSARRIPERCVNTTCG